MIYTQGSAHAQSPVSLKWAIKAFMEHSIRRQEYGLDFLVQTENQPGLRLSICRDCSQDTRHWLQAEYWILLLALEAVLDKIKFIYKVIIMIKHFDLYTRIKSTVNVI